MGLRDEINADLLEELSSPDGLLDATCTLTVSKKTSTVSSNPLKGVDFEVVNYEARLAVVAPYDLKVADGVNIQMGDKDVMILQSQVGCEPAPGDSVTIGGHEHEVISVTQDPALVTWQLQIRGTHV